MFSCRNNRPTAETRRLVPVAYAEYFHGVFHSVAYGGRLNLVCAVCDVISDVIFMFSNQRFAEVC